LACGAPAAAGYPAPLGNFFTVQSFAEARFCGAASAFFVCRLQQPCHVREIFVFLRAETKHIKIMTAMELNAQIWRDIAEIADSELLMKQLAKYLKKLTAKKHDPTLMTKEEFFAKIEKAEQQIAAGEGMAMLPDEDLSAFLKRNGYGL
jgi:hypothetical protein